MITKFTTKQRKPKRVARIRAKIRGTEKRPRLSFYRSSYALYAQSIDDDGKKTAWGVSVKGKNKKAAEELAVKVLEKTKEHKTHTMVFDRGGYKYHGVVLTFVSALRNGGIKI